MTVWVLNTEFMTKGQWWYDTMKRTSYRIPKLAEKNKNNQPPDQKISKKVSGSYQRYHDNMTM